MTPWLADRIRALALAGLRPCQIHERIERRASLASIGMLMSKARLAGDPIPRHRRGPIAGTRVRFDAERSAALLPYATARQMTVAALVRALIAAAVADNMIDAILDDGGNGS